MSHFKAKMHQIRFRLGLRPDPAGRAYSAPPDPPAVFKGLTSKGEGGRRGREEGKGNGREGKRQGRGGEGEGKGGEKRTYTPPVANSWLRHCS